MTFELWTWVWLKSYLIGLWPILAQDEYALQMLALLSYVAARTELPLYDLRQDAENRS